MPDSCFDVVTAGQCWHWFDRAKAAREVYRILKPGGILVIAHFDWLPQHGNVADATEKLIEHFNPRWGLAGSIGIRTQWFADLSGSGFEEIESFSFDVDIPYTHAQWIGRVRASAGVGATLKPDEVAQFSDELAALLARDFAENPLTTPHRIFAVLGRKPGRAADRSKGSIVSLDHVQLAMPPEKENEARRFYVDVLGMTEVQKPAALSSRGGVWFASRGAQLHLGVENDFKPGRKAHPALRCRNYGALKIRLIEAGYAVTEAAELFLGSGHAYVFDPFGNRIELIDSA